MKEAPSDKALQGPIQLGLCWQTSEHDVDRNTDSNDQSLQRGHKPCRQSMISMVVLRCVRQWEVMYVPLYLFDPVCIYVLTFVSACVPVFARTARLVYNVHMCLLFVSSCLWVCGATRGKHGIEMHKDILKLDETEP